MGKYLRGSVDEQQALGTLAGQTLIGQDFDETVNERTLVSSIVATWSLSNFTAIEDCGPIAFGVAHGDYTDAEIEEVIENAGSWNEGALIEQEKSKRKIRRIGMFDTPPTATQTFVVNDGKPVKTKLNWILNQGETLRMWSYNTGQAACATTGPDVRVQGHVNLWPR